MTNLATPEKALNMVTSYLTHVDKYELIPDTQTWHKGDITIELTYNPGLTHAYIEGHNNIFNLTFSFPVPSTIVDFTWCIAKLIKTIS